MNEQDHIAGFVSIIGRPNAGKSTLLNAILDFKLSIISPKAQTTRNRIIGIYNDDNSQLIFSDTPGILKPSYKLHEKMIEGINESVSDADVVVVLHPADEPELHEEVLKVLTHVKVPVILALNKIDLLSQDEIVKRMEHLKKAFAFKSVIPLSALNKFNSKELVSLVKEYLPQNPPYYPKDQLTDRPERFFVSEIIREKIFHRYKEEIPYSTNVVIDFYKESDKIIHIIASIIVERESQKGIIIGKKGLALKNAATAARKELENFLQNKVFLEVFVKVEDDWKNSKRLLRDFGFE